MILNRKDDNFTNSTSKSNLQEEIEENSRRHLSIYDSIIGTSDIEGSVAV